MLFSKGKTSVIHIEEETQISGDQINHTNDEIRLKKTRKNMEKHGFVTDPRRKLKKQNFRNFLFFHFLVKIIEIHDTHSALPGTARHGAC